METLTVSVPISSHDYDQLSQIATTRELSVSALLAQLTSEFLATEEAPAAQYQAIAEAQALYPGEYAAIWQNRVVAHAPQATTVLQRVREELGLSSDAVLLVKLTKPELRIRHPRLITA